MQHMHQLSLQSTLRPSPLAGSSSAGRLPATQQNTASTVPTARSLATQYNTASTVPVVPRSAALSAAVPSGPLHINTITPSTANMRVGGEIRAPAPYLQPFRPSVSVPATNLASLPRTMPSQPVLPPLLHSQANQSGAHIRPTEPESGGPAVTQNIHPSAVELLHSQANESWSPIRPIEPKSGGLAATQKTHPSAVELLMDVHRQSDALRSNISPPLADAGSNFDSTKQSDLATARRVQDSSTTSALPADVVCLSDDE